MAYFVYILRCADDTLYVGYTNDLAKRLHRHNHLKSGARYTKARRPVSLAYSEAFSTAREARRRECELKSWKREDKLALMRQAGKVP